MSDIKELIDVYAAENQVLKQQIESLMSLIRDLTVLHKDEKGVVRLSGKIRKQAEKFGLEIKLLKTSVVLTVKEKTDD